MNSDREAAMRALRERSPVLQYASDAMLECVANATLEAFVTHGEHAIESPRSTAAIHEAGHAVIYAAAETKVALVKVFLFLM